ncbi:unnamed protein product [Symbiodinium natans]|uniref:DUF4281 domain-containing protein n=1 Tax=Symbiodinium natans TaxID=878477 RepID=A0A812QGL1_9DINO|nr:unnamed protein product [Symbiodinium natans]
MEPCLTARRGRRLCCALLLLAVLAPPDLTFGAKPPVIEEVPREEFEVFGYKSADLFPVTNSSLLSWAFLIFFPHWRHLKPVVLLAPIVNAIAYTIVVLYVFSHPNAQSDEANMKSLEGITAMFSNQDGVFAGWLHYCVFDPLVGLGEVLDSQQVGVPHLFVVPCLLMTMFLGPAGFLLYLAIRWLAIYVKDDGFSVQ